VPTLSVRPLSLRRRRSQRRRFARAVDRSVPTRSTQRCYAISIFFRDQRSRANSISRWDRLRRAGSAPGRTDRRLSLILEVKADGVIKRSDIAYDNMYEAIPPSVSILRAITIPALAVTPHSPTQLRLRKLDAIRSQDRALESRMRVSAKRRKDLTPNARRNLPQNIRRTISGRPHSSRTGERTLFVCEAYSENVSGSKPKKRRAPTAALRSHKAAEIKCACWRVNSIAMWIIARQHYAVTDYSEPRHSSALRRRHKPFGP